jgi:hypothetical protein
VIAIDRTRRPASSSSIDAPNLATPSWEQTVGHRLEVDAGGRELVERRLRLRAAAGEPVARDTMVLERGKGGRPAWC